MVRFRTQLDILVSVRYSSRGDERNRSAKSERKFAERFRNNHGSRYFRSIRAKNFAKSTKRENRLGIFASQNFVKLNFLTNSIFEKFRSSTFRLVRQAQSRVEARSGNVANGTN